MKSDTDIPAFLDEKTLKQWMACEMTRLAIHGEKEIEVRSLFRLQKAGVLKEVGPDRFPWIKLAEMVSNPKHRLRVASPLGPCILIRPEKTNEGHKVYQVANLLMAKSVKCRKVALSHLDKLASEGHLTGRSKMAIQEARSNLISTDVNHWKAAATIIYDVTEQDWLLNFAGLVQAVEWDFEIGIQDYLFRVLQPEIVSIDSIDLVWWHPDRQQDEIQQAISDIASSASTFTEALDRYFHSLGHLPFASGLSMGQLVADWQAQNPDKGQLWDELWLWANNRNCPIARYHACQTAIELPGLIPTSSLSEFWLELSDLLSAEIGDGGKWGNAFSLRFHLARHYCQYFECLIPWNDGERSAALAWWLSGQVALLLEKTDATLESLQDMFFARTHWHWHLARNRAGVSELRLKTLFSPSIWQRSLIGTLSNSTSLGFDISAADIKQREIVGICMALHAWRDFRLNLPDYDVAKPGYAFEFSLEQSLQNWLVASPDDEMKHQLGAFFDTFPDIRSASLLEQLTTSNSFILFGLRNDTYTQSLQLSLLEKLLRDDTAARNILTTMDETPLWIFMDTLLESAAATETEWRLVVPHALAVACLECEDEERRDLLFMMAIHSSVATDTVSGIHLILNHSNSHKFIELISLHHNHFIKHMNAAPLRIAARIRPILVALDSFKHTIQ